VAQEKLVDRLRWSWLSIARLR